MIRRIAPAVAAASLNAGLRALTLASKFFLVVALARFLTADELGVYGLMVSSVAFAVFGLGLEYHYYTIRALVSAPAGERAVIMRDQAILHLLTCLVLLPLLAAGFALARWAPVPPAVMGWFYLLVVVELASNEAGIALVGLSRPLSANLVLFVRSGLWVYAIVALFFVIPTTRSAATVFAVWATGSAVSVVVAAANLRGIGWRAILVTPIRWRATLRGVRVAAPFLVTTGASLGLLFFDRFVIEASQSLTLVGVYVFFGSITTAVHTLVNTGVSLVRMPRLVLTYQEANPAAFRRELGVMARLTIAGVAILVPLLAIGVVPTIAVVGQPLYAQNLQVYYVLLAAAGIRCVADIPLYTLYAQRRDMALLAANVSAFAVSASLDVALIPSLGLPGAALAAVAGALALFGVSSAIAHLTWRARLAGLVRAE